MPINLKNDPAYWKAADLAAREDWRLNLSAPAIAELETVVANLSGKSPPDITLDENALPSCKALMAEIRELLENGPGLALLSGLPDWSSEVMIKAFWLLGLQLGAPHPQDAAGKLIHDVRDTGADITKDNVRIYQTNLEQEFHNDGGDVFMLMCRRQAKLGGRSRTASVPALFAEIQARRPDLAEILTQPFHFDARGQELPGRPPVQVIPLITLHDGRPYAIQKRPYIRFAQRFDDVPRLTETQTEALDLLDELCADPEFQYSYDMEPGQIAIGLNHVILHARDSYEDFEALDERRHMVRLWLGLPDGPPLPEHYRDTREFGALFEITERRTPNT
ncbi:MAG: TauD/TfdA family dioxygenase [Rhodospirillaceae bacterium]|jgi:hypothetical protein|nr:TauD/TfdA family dioxygenase [Rhodospirillaceae bacterium]